MKGIQVQGVEHLAAPAGGEVEALEGRAGNRRSCHSARTLAGARVDMQIEAVLQPWQQLREHRLGTPRDDSEAGENDGDPRLHSGTSPLKKKSWNGRRNRAARMAPITATAATEAAKRLQLAAGKR